MSRLIVGDIDGRIRRSERHADIAHGELANTGRAQLTGPLHEHGEYGVQIRGVHSFHPTSS